MSTHADLSAIIKDTFYSARDNGRTMHEAADEAATKIVEVIAGEKAAALTDAADLLEEKMGPVWGGSREWLTTGQQVADLVGEVLRDWAEDAWGGRAS